MRMKQNGDQLLPIHPQADQWGSPIIHRYLEDEWVKVDPYSLFICCVLLYVESLRVAGNNAHSIVIEVATG